jgi:hypothetical protein
VKAAALRRRQAIKFLIHLSQRDLQELFADDRPGDLLNVCVDLCRWGFYRGMRPRESRGEDVAAIFRTNPELLGTLIENLRHLLTTVADGGTYRFDFVPGAGVIFDAGLAVERDAETLKIRGKLPTNSLYYAHKRQPPVIWLQCLWTNGEGFQQMALYRAMMLLSESEEGAMVRRCVREGCRRVFLAARPKQIFCRRQCANAAVFERYKQKLGAEVYRVKHAETARLWKAKKSARRRLVRSVKALRQQGKVLKRTSQPPSVG